MPARPVGQGIDQTRRGAIHADPVVHRGRPQPGRVGNRRNVQQQVGRAAEGRVHQHGVLERMGREDPRDRNPQGMQPQQGERGAGAQFEPRRLA